MLCDKDVDFITAIIVSRGTIRANKAVMIGWAAFSGKGTFTAPGADAEGNHSFTVYAEDAGDPGVGLDRFWIQTRNKTNAMVQDLSLDAPAVDEAAMIEGGNIFAPHGGGKGRP